MAEISLHQFIESTECLNEDQSNSVKNLFSAGSAFLESDADHQLLIKIRFRQPVKISGLRFHGVHEDTAPSDIRIFQNDMHLDFGGAEDGCPTQELSLQKEENNLGDKQVTCPLKFAKFSSVNDLSIFVMENLGNEEKTQIKHLEILGQPAEKSNIADWKPCKS